MGHELRTVLVLLVDSLCLEEKVFAAVFWGLSRRVVLLPCPALSLCGGVSLQYCPIPLREAAEPGKSLQELRETRAQKEEEFQPWVRMWPRAFCHALPALLAQDQSLCYSLFSPSCYGCPPQALQCSSSAPCGVLLAHLRFLRVYWGQAATRLPSCSDEIA